MMMMILIAVIDIDGIDMNDVSVDYNSNQNE